MEHGGCLVERDTKVNPLAQIEALNG